ncbi:SIR2 family protein [Rossellomorea marisflavi]|uniref:SIR2 family protein n=1 Tax=Rossellomorea marisflavi TaxID=189381 RepID=UPI00296FDA29|nr:SIR2 family protein [Rossellomorea marisflavi]MDW4528778.1 SIR2 family protein [Rossellomorea marisflavi]
MDDKIMSLSFSVEANQGVYALLLGSGISYSSGIPTGWGVLKELCRRIMQVDGSEEPDEIKWYEEKFGTPPLYDEVIGMLAKTPSERNGLLKEFFEPTEEDLKEGRKVPTEAHKSIAELVKKGYIKVIVTTNFDRLIEQALDELNVQYQTLYHDSDIEGMKPLAHADCTVLKIHGDYRDTRFKNITDELKCYSSNLSGLLKQVFDDYGLIISGWSAEWDTALRDTIKSVKGRRYSWYWHSFSESINEKAEELINFRDANLVIDSGGADHFFREIKEAVFNISNLKKVNPENIQVKIKRLKDYIQNDDEPAIRDLFTNELRDVIGKINKLDSNQEVTIELMKQWIEEIKVIIKPISVLSSILAYYGKGEFQERLLIETLERFTSIKGSDGRVYLLGLKQLPLQAVFYSMGISLTMRRKYKLLDEIMMKPKVRDRLHSRQAFSWYVSPRRDLYDAFQRLQPERPYHLPIEVMFTFPFMEEVFEESQLAFDSVEYMIHYDLFEFLRSLKHRYLSNYDYYSGIFGYKIDRTHIEQFLSEGSIVTDWEVLVLFEGSKSLFIESLRKLSEDLNQDTYFSGRGLVEAYLKEK